MNTLLKSVTALALSATVGFASAGNMCKNFEISLKNNTQDMFVITDINLTDGEYSNGGLGKLAKGDSRTIIVSQASEDKDMQGTLSMHTPSLPSKNVDITFTLKNTGVHCHIKNIKSSGDFYISDTRTPGSETFTVNNK